jgi:hypothetical protein
MRAFLCLLLLAVPVSAQCPGGNCRPVQYQTQPQPQGVYSYPAQVQQPTYVFPPAGFYLPPPAPAPVALPPRVVWVLPAPYYPRR